jgi:putative chitinase
MNRSYFFERIRHALFGGRLTPQQVEGLRRILDYRDSHHPAMSDDQLAYVLATIKWETGHRMTPVREAGGERYLKTKKYYPWVGEGLVQVTWEENARKFGATKPGDLMSWPLALQAAFEGMTRGLFTRRKLADYIDKGAVDYIGARRIINGQDRARLIAQFAHAFRDALRQAQTKPLVSTVLSQKEKEHSNG